MLRNRWIPVFPVVAGLAFTACDRSPTEPQDTGVGQFETALNGGLGGPAGPRHAQMHLPRLLRQAVDQVREEQGDEAARSITAELRALLDQGRAIREAGDREAMRAHMDAVRAATAELIIEILGAGIAGGTVSAAEAALAAWRDGIAARAAEGKDVTRLEALVERADALLATAQGALAAGDYAIALDHASRVIDFATRRPPHGGPAGVNGPGRQTR